MIIVFNDVNNKFNNKKKVLVYFYVVRTLKTYKLKIKGTC